MAFEVKVVAAAKRDIDLAARYIAEDSVAAAAKWKARLAALLNSLSEMPHRFSVLAEAAELDGDYRVAHHFSHRVIFRIDASTESVIVLRVYHSARNQLKPDQIE